MHGSYDKISPNNGELLINGIDEGTAVRDVASLLGYSVADTIAIGDSDNDTAMLKAAGTSVAMGNAIHGIQAFCDFTTTDIHQETASPTPSRRWDWCDECEVLASCCCAVYGDGGAGTESGR